MILHKTGQKWGNYPCEKVISSLLKIETKEFTGSPLSMKTRVCASMLVSVVHEYQSIIKCHGDERWSLLASQEVTWEPLTLLHPLHLQVHICWGCKLDWPTDVLWCVLAGNSLWGFIQLRNDMQLCGCCLQLNVPPHKGSRVCWDVGHLNFTSTPIQHPAFTPVDAGLSSPPPWNSSQIETVLYREVMKNDTSKTKTPVFIFKKVLQAEKLVAHQHRPVTDSHSVFECLGLKNARMRLTRTYH